MGIQFSPIIYLGGTQIETGLHRIHLTEFIPSHRQIPMGINLAIMMARWIKNQDI